MDFLGIVVPKTVEFRKFHKLQKVVKTTASTALCWPADSTQVVRDGMETWLGKCKFHQIATRLQISNKSCTLRKNMIYCFDYIMTNKPHDRLHFDTSMGQSFPDRDTMKPNSPYKNVNLNGNPIIPGSLRTSDINHAPINKVTRWRDRKCVRNITKPTQSIMSRLKLEIFHQGHERIPLRLLNSTPMQPTKFFRPPTLKKFAIWTNPFCDYLRQIFYEK